MALENQQDGAQSGLRPGWLFIIIVGILLGHYVFLGVSLKLCYNVLEREAEILLDKIERSSTDQVLTKEDTVRGERVCGDIADQFRNARNKALEVILALLVPSGLVLNASAGRSSQVKPKQQAVVPPRQTPVMPEPPIMPPPGKLPPPYK